MILWVSAGFSTFSLYLRINCHSIKLSFSVRDVLPSFPHLCLVSEEAYLKDAGEAGNRTLGYQTAADVLHLILSILKYSFCINLSPDILWRSCFNGCILNARHVRKFCSLLNVNFSNAVKRRSHEFSQNFFNNSELGTQIGFLFTCSS